ncbi:unnamed protein product [Wuchereria bancrofti]|uniref:Uncharacterized protein n=1 Tax=Wuchereria bancrofti TaxID=6293 RepID=A0A3P7EDU6_WUCBA|nr:unnamed protein product [Wuchereria bancrofti]
MSIPRLELLAVLIGMRMVQFVLEQMELEDVRTILWSDSQCALHFTMVPVYYQPTKGISPNKLKEYDLWWKGPKRLTENESKWPQWNYNYNGEYEKGVEIVARITEPTIINKNFEIIDVSGFSKWLRLIKNDRLDSKIYKINKEKENSLAEDCNEGKEYIDKTGLRVGRNYAIRQAQSEGVTKDAITKWNLFYDNELWRLS